MDSSPILKAVQLILPPSTKAVYKNPQLRFQHIHRQCCWSRWRLLKQEMRQPLHSQGKFEAV